MNAADLDLDDDDDDDDGPKLKEDTRLDGADTFNASARTNISLWNFMLVLVIYLLSDVRCLNEG